MLDIPGDRYEQAFDAAVDVARAHGMQPVVRDRREGLIETDPVIAGTFFEPWYGDTADFAQGIDNTLSQYRMRARFEFLPRTFIESSDMEAGEGPDLLGVSIPPRDLANGDIPLELRVWVYRERKHTVGQRRSTWTRRIKSRADHGTDDPDWEQTPSTFWTPATRDEAAERRLLSEIAQRLRLPSTPKSD
ncbi:MAG: hypothetical protein MK085_11275 [Phycisphaerales bacterium]|nr:hypothetical protein [Phycisphaerales bacterium]